MPPPPPPPDATVRFSDPSPVRVLTRALLGLVRTLPAAGGGGRSGPPSISETNRRREKIQTAMESPGRDPSDKVKKFDLEVTCDVTGQVKHKCLTFPFNAFPRQNAGNKRISSQC